MTREFRPRVLLADDHRLVAEGLKSLLSADYELVGVVEDGLALIEAARRLQPDVIVADITMPHLNGIDALVQLKQDNKQVKVVILTMHADAAYVRRAIEAGALGYVLKHAAPIELTAAINSAMDGKLYVSPAVAKELSQTNDRKPVNAVDLSSTFSTRQREILQLLADGRSVEQISVTLAVSTRMIEFHMHCMAEKLNLTTEAELTHFAVRHANFEI